MRFVELDVKGCWLIELEPCVDERGYFARAFCSEEFSRRGLNTSWPQINMSWNPRAYTLRGLHYQMRPHEEIKMVCCMRGRIWDVALDLRPGSPTFRRYCGVELSLEPPRWLYVPAGCAHGFLTLAEESLVLYLVSAPYAPKAERGVRWDDPYFNIEWPARPALISAKDSAWPDFCADDHC